MITFDFDYWKNLAAVDVEAFKVQSKFIIARDIKRISKGDKYRELQLTSMQAKLNNSRCSNNLVNAQVAFNKMLVSFYELNENYKEL